MTKQEPSYVAGSDLGWFLRGWGAVGCGGVGWSGGGGVGVGVGWGGAGVDLIKLAYLLYVFGKTSLSKQCRPRSDTVERGV